MKKRRPRHFTEARLRKQGFRAEDLKTIEIKAPGEAWTASIPWTHLVPGLADSSRNPEALRRVAALMMDAQAFAWWTHDRANSVPAFRKLLVATRWARRRYRTTRATNLKGPRRRLTVERLQAWLAEIPAHETTTAMIAAAAERFHVAERVVYRRLKELRDTPT